MKLIIDTFNNTGTIHHAYILEGGADAVREELLAFISASLKHPVQANPDFWHERFDTFTIDEARKLRDRQAEMSFAGGRKVFVIETGFMTVEAQNALLKMFEEPNANTHFFLLMPSAEILLPTLRSRVVVVPSGREAAGGEAKKFLKLSVSERLRYVGGIIEMKDKLRAIGLVEELVAELSRAAAFDHFKIEELLKARSYLNDRSPSLKLILEHLALIV